MAKHYHERRRQKTMTPFEKEWGIARRDLAEQEMCTPDAISMRVRNFGNPWQRRAKPTHYEKKYARTLYEIAEERNLHPITVIGHEKRYNNIWYYNPDHHNTGVSRMPYNGVHWRYKLQGNVYKSWANQYPWLHPDHPDYEHWRSGKMFPEYYVGGSSLTTEQIEQLMFNKGWKRY